MLYVTYLDYDAKIFVSVSFDILPSSKYIDRPWTH